MDALLKYETLNRAEFLAVMETGEVTEGLGDDKPRTTAQVLEEVKDVLAAEERERAERQQAEQEAENNPDSPEMLN